MPIAGATGKQIGQVGQALTASKSFGKINPPQAYIQTPQGPLGINVFGSKPRDSYYVAGIQRTLRALGLYKGPIDGIWGPGTERGWRLYNQSARKGYGPYGSTLGAQASYALFQKQFFQREAKKIQAAYQQLQQTIYRLQGQGQITDVDAALMQADYWRKQAGKAGGVFNKVAASQAKRFRELSNIEKAQTRQLELLKAEQEKQLHPNLPTRALGFVQRDILAPVGRSPVGRYVLSPVNRYALQPAGRSVVGRALIAAVTFPHEVVNRAVYAEQFLRRQEGRSIGPSINPFQSSRDQREAISVTLGALGLKRFQTKKIQAALSATSSPALREALRHQGRLVSFGESVAGKSGWESAFIDFVYNFADPTLAVGSAFKAISFIGDLRKATQFLAKTPAAAESLTKAIADLAEKAARRAPAGLEVGDVRLLQRQVPSLRPGRKGASELAATLVSRGTEQPTAYLRLLEATAERGVAEGNPASRQLLANVQNALSKLIDDGMTTETRQAILKASLGVTWKPRVPVAALLGGRVANLSLPFTERALAAMPYATREVKLATLSRLLSRKAGLDVSYIGKYVGTPEEGNLLRFTERSAADRAAAGKLLSAIAKSNFHVEVELKGLSTRLQGLPSSPFKDIMLRRLDDVEIRVRDYLKGQLDSLTSLEKGFLKLNPAQLQNELDAAKRLVKERLARLERVTAPGTPTAGLEKKLANAQDRLRSLQNVEDIQKGRLRQKALVKELQQLRKESVGFTKLQPVSLDRAIKNFNSELRDYEYMIGAKPATRVSPWTGAIRAAGRTFNDTPRSAIIVHDLDERSKTMRDWALALGQSRPDADAIYARMARTMAEEDALAEAKSLQEGVIHNFLVQQGLPRKAVKETLAEIHQNGQDFLREYQGWYSVLNERARRFKSKFDKVYGVKGEKSPQVLSQDQYTFYLVSPEDLRRYVLEWKRKNGSFAAAALAGVDIAGEKLAEAYSRVHYAWKYAMLTAAPVRYVLRVAFLEERLRMWMTHGFASFTQISSKHARRLNNLSLERTAGGRWFGGFEHVGIEGLPMHFMDKSLIEITGHGVVDKGGRGFTENAWNILMRQVRPEDDLIHHALMPHLWTGDEAALKAARESVIETLETTEKGEVYRHKAMLMDRKYNDSEFMVDKVESWLRDVMPNQAIIDKRLDGQFPLTEFERHEEWWPEKTWGDKYESLWSIPFTAGAGSKWKTLWGRLVIQSPTTALNRQPFAFAEFAKEFDSLTASGLDARTASEWATLHAEHRTNEILYDASVRSRFSHKLDIVFPFQQAREETVRVWSKLLREDPARAAYTLGLFARAFNAGVNEGTITKNSYGQWTMKVPSSPALSRALGRYAPSWVPFKEGLTQTAGTRYSFALQNLLFVNDPWGTTPRPGGPWWVVAANAAIRTNPDLFPTNKFWQKYLFDERNPSTLVWRPEMSRLWVGLTGNTTIPWEPFSWGHIGTLEPAGERLRDKLAGEVGAELYRQWIDAGANPKDKPTAEDIDKATRAALVLHGLLGMFVPAAMTATVPGREEFQSLLKSYTVDGQVNFSSLIADHPDMAGFAFAHYTDPVRVAYTRDDGTIDIKRLMAANPGYWEHWRQRGSPRDDSPEMLVDQIYQARDYMSPEEFTDAVDRSRRISSAWQQYYGILNSGVPAYQRITELAQLERDNSDLGEWQDTRMKAYRRDLEFDMIMKRPPVERDDLLKQWQYKYDVSFQQMSKLTGQWTPNLSHYNPWAEARNVLDVAEMYQHNNEGGGPVDWAAKHLTPAEQFNFFTYMMGNARDIKDFNELYAGRGAVGAKYAKLLFRKNLEDTTGNAEDWWAKVRHDASMTIGKKYDHINAIAKLMQETAQAASAAHGAQKHALWQQYYALKDKRQRIYAEIRGIQNSLYHKFPDLTNLQDEVSFLRLTTGPNAKREDLQDLEAHGIPFFQDNQERKWAEMPERIKADSVQDLVERLTLPAYYSLTKRGSSRLYWDYLTEFQKDMLRKRLDSKQIDQIKRMSADAAHMESLGRGGRRFKFRRFRFRRFRWQVWGHTLGDGFGEIAFALEMFRQWNRRGDMQAPQAELDEYKRLKDNPLLKTQYLKTHPRLQAWLRAGPMANMPPVVAEIVKNIMIKYGRWDSQEGVLSWDDIAELGFAHTILKKYSKREGAPPPAYETWLKMPTGKARFDYMRQHPEIERWLQDGPMAQMPQEYREVVRDIMTKFGEWDKRTDPLSVLLERYFQTPDHAKQDFLENHPEIVAYWRAIRSGRDRQLFDLAQTYFALPDKDSKTAFIQAHPELQDYFIEERRRRYESFLNDVARYLGQVPEIAESYLRDQTKFIHEMLDKFALRPLVPPTVTHVSTVTRREI